MNSNIERKLHSALVRPAKWAYLSCQNIFGKGYLRHVEAVHELFME